MRQAKQAISSSEHKVAAQRQRYDHASDTTFHPSLYFHCDLFRNPAFRHVATCDSAETKTIEVSFPSFDNFLLEGTFYPPLDSTGADAPAPGVVLIHGSGPQSRDYNLNGQVGMFFPFSILAS